MQKTKAKIQVDNWFSFLENKNYLANLSRYNYSSCAVKNKFLSTKTLEVFENILPFSLVFFLGDQVLLIKFF